MVNEPYVLKKNGMYYAHNDCGYVSSVVNAEIYTKEYAINYAKKSFGEISAKPISSITSLGKLKEVQERLGRMVCFLEQAREQQK